MLLDDIIHNIPKLSQDAVFVNYRAGPESSPEIVWVNDALCQAFLADNADFIGRHPNCMFDENYRQDFDQTVADTIEKGEGYFFTDTLCKRRDGSQFWGRVSFLIVPNDDGVGRHSIATIRNIDDLKQREQAAELALIENEHLLSEVEAAQTRLISAINMVPDPFLIFDSRDRLVIWNPAVQKQVGDHKDSLVKGMKKAELLRLYLKAGRIPSAIGREEEWIKDYMEEWAAHSSRTTTMAIGDRAYRTVYNRAPNGDTVVLRIDISDFLRQKEELEDYAKRLEIANDEISHQVLHDELTGLGNRRFLNAKLDELIAARAAKGGEIAALHIDLDRFKLINDTMGHSAGDHVLKVVADILRQCLRKTDIAARIGGDEFVVLMQCEKDSEDPEILSERLIAEVKRPTYFEGRVCRVGASIGIARTPVIDAMDLVTSADVALYKAKEGGRSRKAVFDLADLESVRQTKLLADDIMRGLDKAEFVPVYQPQIDAETEQVIGFEVLARWHHPEKGLLDPSKFLAVAEDIQVMGLIDKMIFRRAVAECMNAFGHVKDTPSLSFNVGLQRIMDGHLLDDVKRQRYPGKIALELLETIFLEEESYDFFANLTALRKNDVTFEVDDFGSGRASIVGLRRIAPDRLKIDRRLVQPIADSESARKLVRSIIDIGRALDIGVTAEGVETAKHAEILRDIGCTRFQGYHYGKPVLLSAFDMDLLVPVAPTRNVV